MLTKQDQASLRRILPRLTDHLRTQKPKKAGKTMEEAALNARERDGFDECIEKLKEAAEGEQKEVGGTEFLDGDEP